MLSTDEINRYSRQIKLANIGLEGQNKLKRARVLCVGAGGLASPLLLYLAAAGVGTLGIIDEDTIEISNLHRQVLYPHQQIGHQKVDIAKAQITALNPDVQVITYPQRLTAKNAAEIIAQYDVIADCTDNFFSRYLINDVCFLQNKPFVSASIAQYEGQCTLFLGRQGPCYRCLFPASPAMAAIPNCNEGGVLGVLPGIFGTLQATEIMKYILNIGEGLSGRLLLLNILTMQWREMQYTKNATCDTCVKQIFDFLHKEEVIAMSHEISLQELHQRLTNQEPVFLLDVRTTEEHEGYNLGGVLIPLSELPGRLTELNPKLDIVVYCRSGGRSLQAVELLKTAGFESVRSLAGGVLGVQQSRVDFSSLVKMKKTEAHL